MIAPSDCAQPQGAMALPIEFQALCPTPQLLPGESLNHYHAIQVAIFRDIDPQSAIEASRHRHRRTVFGDASLSRAPTPPPERLPPKSH